MRMAEQERAGHATANHFSSIISNHMHAHGARINSINARGLSHFAYVRILGFCGGGGGRGAGRGVC